MRRWSGNPASQQPAGTSRSLEPRKPRDRLAALLPMRPRPHTLSLPHQPIGRVADTAYHWWGVLFENAYSNFASIFTVRAVTQLLSDSPEQPLRS